MSAPLAPIPYSDDLLEAQKLAGTWYRWLYTIWTRLGTCVALVAAAAKSLQQAAILTTSVGSVTQTGIYRVAYALEVTQLATTSYALAVTLGWRDGGVTKSQVFASLSGAPGTLATGVQNGSTVIRADSGTVITYAVSYASVGGTVCQYRIDVAVELLN